MPPVTGIKPSFAGGEFAPALHSRVDLSKYATGAARLRNFIAHPHGGISNRPGLKYVATGKTSGKKCRVIPFEFSTAQAYMLEFGDYYVRFNTSGAPILTSSYSVDHYTKLLMHCEGANNGVAFTDETGKTVTNMSLVTLDHMEYSSDALAQAAYVTSDTGSDFISNLGAEVVTQYLGTASAHNYNLGEVFTLAVVTKITGVKVRFGATTGSPSGASVRIETLSSGLPTGTLADANLVKAFTPTQNATNTITFDTAATLPAGTYALVLACGAQTNNNYWVVSVTSDADYADGNAVRKFDGTWDNDWIGNYDLAFAIIGQSLQCYSEATIKSAGSYSLKGGAWGTSSLNETLTKTIGAPIDLSDQVLIKFDIRSSRTGANIKVGIHDSGGTTSEKTYTVVAANTWETVSWDISAVSNANKNAIDSIIITIVNADASNTFYIDKMFAGIQVITDTSVHALGASSGYFDGTTYLTLANSTDFDPETADFTYEQFVSFETLDDMWLCGNGAETSSGWGLKYDNTAHTLAFWANNGSRATVSFTPVAETLYHVAVVRSSGVIKLSIDGVFGSGSNYATAITSAYSFTLGKDSQIATNYFNGWIDEVRWSRGVVRWPADFTPPVAGSIPYEIVSPYAEADLPLLNFTQSADVLYLTHPDYAPRQLERLGNTDWELNLYDYENGPFMIPNSDDTMTLDVSAVSGDDKTLTATGFTFNALHVGALFKLTHYIESQAVTAALGSVTAASSIKCGGTWRLITHGSWTGTIRVKKSTDGGSTWTCLREFSSAIDYNVDTYGTEDMANNAEPFLVRVNMTAYTSGTCNTNLTSDAFYQDGIVEITAVAVGGATATVDVLRTCGLTTATADWAEGSWSDYRGWPANVEFHPEDRLVFANTLYEPQTYWMTKNGQYTNFAFSDPLIDSDSISSTIPSRKVNGINGLFALTEMIALTLSNEVSIKSSSGPLSPTTVYNRIHGWEGSYGIRPVVIGNRAIYVQSTGSIIRDIGYDLYQDSFVGNDLTIFSNHLFAGHTVVEMAYQQNPDRLLWVVRDDGILLSMTYMREQEVIAWTWHDTGDGDDLFESVACIRGSGYDEVWVVVNRGGERYIERMVRRLESTALEDQFFVDSGITYDSTPATAITGLDHLEDRTVAILADGEVLDQQVVANGQVTLDVAASVVQVGLPYEAELETLNIDANLQDGTIQGKNVVIPEVVLRFLNSKGGWIGQDEDNLYALDFAQRSDYDPTELFSGEHPEPTGAEYKSGGRIFFRQADPLPVTITAVIPTLEIGGQTQLR